MALLIIDEPFNNLDIDSVVKVINILYSIHRERGISIIVTSHFPLFIGVNKKWSINNYQIIEQKLLQKYQKLAG